MPFPDAIRAYVADLLLTTNGTAFVELDREQRIVAVGGSTRLFGPAELAIGTPLPEIAAFTIGLELSSEAVRLPRIATSGHRWVDVHLLPASDGGGYLLLEDSTQAVRRELELLQKANELALMKRTPAVPDRAFKTFFSALNQLATCYQDGRLVPLGDLPAWGGRFVPLLDAPMGDWQDDPSLAFLGAFMEDADAFWSHRDIGSIRSGVWIDDDLDGTEFLYEATAAYTGSQRILMLTRVDSASAEKQSLIQTGRNLALSHRDLDRNQTQLVRANSRLQKRARSRRDDLEDVNRRLEAALRKRAELEGERAAILESAEQSQRLEALGSLAGGIAHDFNNVLAAVLGFAELGQAPEADPANGRSYFRSIEAAALRAQDLVRQILAMTGRSESDRTHVRIKDITSEVVGLMRATLASSIDIRADLHVDATVQAVPTELHQVLMNLCTNAAHAMRARGGTLNIALRTADVDTQSLDRHPDLLPGGYAVLSVADSGAGISPENLPKIFTPFFTTKESGEGTGIGLSVVHGIVTRAGGAIEVRSEFGRGTVFEVYWPLSDASPTRSEAAVAEPRPGHEHILFVDDEPMQVEIATQMLGRLGYHVSAFTRSTEALEAFRQAPEAYELVISDLSMPDLDGAGLVRAVRGLRPSLPCVLLSGHFGADAEALEQDLGSQCCLQKPVSWRRVADTIRNLLEEPQPSP